MQRKLGDIVQDMADCLDADDEVAASEVIDKGFLGAWSHTVYIDGKLGADVRGLIVAAYREGRRRREGELFDAMCQVFDAGDPP